MDSTHLYEIHYIFRPWWSAVCPAWNEEQKEIAQLLSLSPLNANPDLGMRLQHSPETNEAEYCKIDPFNSEYKVSACVCIFHIFTRYLCKPFPFIWVSWQDKVLSIRYKCLSIRIRAECVMMIINVFLLSVSAVQTRRRPGKTSCHDSDDSPSSSHGEEGTMCHQRRRQGGDNVPTIAMTKIHNFILARDKLRRIGAAALVFSNGFDDSNSPICVCMLACTSGTLLKEMHNVCKRDWEVGAGYTVTQDTDLLWASGEIFKYSFCFLDPLEDRLTGSLAW